jgi:hypothetical protein
LKKTSIVEKASRTELLRVIAFALRLDKTECADVGIAFLRDWNEGDLNDWPEFLSARAPSPTPRNEGEEAK